MTMRMLIDARHQEETRVAVLKGNRIEEFDFESAEHKQLKGNIYLAKVTRVEPSLQAAFVDYGGNRHGFLAFSEIHPDYYQIPIADRERLLAQHAALEREEAQENGADYGHPVEADPASGEGEPAAQAAALTVDSIAEPVTEAGGAVPSLAEGPDEAPRAEGDAAEPDASGSFSDQLPAGL